MTRNAMAREKALYDGHPVAAVAATSESIAKAALKLIKVDYEVLPHVIDPVEAMKPGAPILHEHVRTKGVKGADQPTNVIERLDLAMGDVEAGFAEADVIVEREYDTKPMHQGYIEPQGCVATCDRGRPDRAVVLHAGAVGLSRPAHRTFSRSSRPRSASSSRRWAAASAARPASTASRSRSSSRARPSGR